MRQKEIERIARRHPDLDYDGDNSAFICYSILPFLHLNDYDRQVEYCRRLHEIIAEDQPYTFLYVSKWTAILDRRIVIKEKDGEGRVVYKKITPTKTGNFAFHFNKWIKLANAPDLSAE